MSQRACYFVHKRHYDDAEDRQNSVVGPKFGLDNLNGRSYNRRDLNKR